MSKDKQQALFLGVNSVLKAFTVIYTSNRDNFSSELDKHLKNSKIVYKVITDKQGRKKDFGWCIELSSESFYKLRSLKYGFYGLDRKTTISDNYIKHLEGFRDYKNDKH